jgi:serine/threonine protein kinase
VLHCAAAAAAAALLSQGIILQTMLGVARGMECLHANNCLHGDLKASNVLLSVTEPSVGDGSEASVGEVEIVPKVSDFGLSRVMLEGATHHSTHTMGTITHQAPGVCWGGVRGSVGWGCVAVGAGGTRVCAAHGPPGCWCTQKTTAGTCAVGRRLRGVSPIHQVNTLCCCCCCRADEKWPPVKGC